MSKLGPTRRELIAGLAIFPFLLKTSRAQSQLPPMTVAKDPSCGCCGNWIAYLRAAGFLVTVKETSDVDTIRTLFGVPNDLASCHTAEIGGYVVEGHVPESAIRRLLAEKPAAIGISVPGMPQSAPGMDVPGARDVYDVILFGPAGRQRYGRFQGRRELAT